MWLHCCLSAFLGFSAFASPVPTGAVKYRWFPTPPGLMANLRVLAFEPVPSIVGLPGINRLTALPLRGGQFVEAREQRMGPALVDGTWTQTIFKANGLVAYAAGVVFESLPHEQWEARLLRMQKDIPAATQVASSLHQGYRESEQKFPAQVRVRKLADGTFSAYWRFEYLTPTQEEIRYVNLGERGSLEEQGRVSVTNIDGKGMVYPQGPKWSSITEVPLHALLGDGTLSSQYFKITSALDLDVRSPNLLFYFPDTDRRFDLTQVYYTVERSLRWMKEVLSAELKSPLEVRLHVGERGVSNAAFYYKNIVYLGTGDGVTYQGLTRDPSVVIHESMHALIDAYAGLPSEGEGGSFNEGFADLFTALILKNPALGDSSYLKAPYRRSVENTLRAYQDFSAGIYQNGSIVAATFWDLRGALSDERIAQLAFRTLVRLGRGGEFKDFVPALEQASEDFLSLEEKRIVSDKLLARGWGGFP